MPTIDTSGFRDQLADYRAARQAMAGYKLGDDPNYNKAAHRLAVEVHFAALSVEQGRRARDVLLLACGLLALLATVAGALGFAALFTGRTVAALILGAVCAACSAVGILLTRRIAP